MAINGYVCLRDLATKFNDKIELLEMNGGSTEMFTEIFTCVFLISNDFISTNVFQHFCLFLALIVCVLEKW
jgi:hypothetical protein